MSSARPALPSRPTVPTTIWCLLTVVCVERMVLGASLRAMRHMLLLGAGVGNILALAVASAMIVLHARVGETLRSALVILVAGLLAAGLASMAGLRQQGLRERLKKEAVSGWALIVEGDCTKTEHGYRCLARIGKRDEAGLAWLSLPERLGRGTLVRCVGRYKAPEDDEFGRSTWRQGICGTITAMHILQQEPLRGVLWWPERLRTIILASLDPDASDVRALMAGCVCGYRPAMAECGMVDDFSDLGIAHLIAVSGSHLVIVCSLLAHVLGRLNLTPRERLPLLAATSGMFVIVCGAPVSAVRAWAMSIVSFGAMLAGRRSHALSSVGMVGLTMALFSPATSGQLGFALSVLSVCGLALLAPHADYALRVLVGEPRLPRRTPQWLRRATRSLISAVRSMLAATIVCQLVTMPLTVSTFGRVSLVAPFANLLLGPAITILMGYGLTCATLAGATGIQMPMLRVADVLGMPLLTMARRLARLPVASVSASVLGPAPGIVAVVVAVAWLAWWPRIDRRKVGIVVACLSTVLVALLMRWRLLAPARIVVLDVGQGDAILVQDGGSAVLVDTGPGEVTVEALARQHVLHLDAVVITHLHDDHYGGLETLAGAVVCDSVVVAQGVAASMDETLTQVCRELTGSVAEEVCYGDHLRVGRFSMEMVWPRAPVDGDENAESIELLVCFEASGRSLSALLTGDAERDETGECLTSGDVGDIDLLKVGHHGSEVSVTSEILEGLKPEVAVASAGEGNSYGHPRPECVEMLRDAGALFLCTKDVGDVDVRPDGRGVSVRCRSWVKSDVRSFDQTL